MPAKQPDTRLTIRLTPQERAELAAKAGSTPLSAFVRDLALAKAASKRKGSRTAPVKDHLALAQILAKLGQADVFAALNGLEASSERGLFDLDETAQAEITKACRDIRAIKSLLMDALGIAER